MAALWDELRKYSRGEINLSLEKTGEILGKIFDLLEYFGKNCVPW
jgi:hypothetical protein